jgi:hypothetical protein
VRRAFDSPCPLRAFHPASRPSRAPPWGRSPPATLANFFPAARPSLRLSPRGRSDPAFRGSWSPSRRHPGERHVLWTVTSTAAPPPGFLTLSAVSSQTRASRPSAPRLRGLLHAAAVQDLPLQGSTRRNRASLPGPLAPSSFGVAPRSSADPSCPDLPGLPLTPATFRPTLTEAPGLLPCVLVCGRPRRSGQSPSRARATFHRDRNPGLLVTRRHGEPCSPSRRSVDLGAFFLPRARRPSSHRSCERRSIRGS